MPTQPAQGISARPRGVRGPFDWWGATGGGTGLSRATSTGAFLAARDIWAALAFSTSGHAAPAQICGLHGSSGSTPALRAQAELLTGRGPFAKLRP